MRNLRFGKLWWFGGLVLMALVVLTSLAPPSNLPRVGLSDKVEHFLAYLSLALWFSGLVERPRWWWLAFALFGFGVSIEVAQFAMGWGRSADWHDVAANSAGLATGLALAAIGVGTWAVSLDRRVAAIVRPR